MYFEFLDFKLNFTNNKSIIFKPHNVSINVFDYFSKIDLKLIELN